MLLLCLTAPTPASADSPFSWAVTNVDSSNDLTSVSCPSASLCVAGETGGNVVTSTNPTGGAGAWTVADASESGATIKGVSCPSASLCVAVDSGGNVVTSTNPTGGAGAWSVAHVGGPGTGISAGLISVSCPSASLCVAVDYDDGVVTATNPTGGAGAWSVTHVEKAGIFNAVSCASTSLCVIVDLIGDVVVGTPAVPPVVDPGSGSGSTTIAPPVVKITSGPAAETTNQRATFTFRGVAGGAYECSIDAGAWAPCTSGETYGPLLPGDHLFRVRETLAGLTGPTASYRWTIDLPRSCVLRVARARIFVAPKMHRVRLVIHYTSYRPAKVKVSYDLLGSKGIVSLGDTSANFSTAGVFRDPEILSSTVFDEVRTAKLFKVRFQIAKTPRSCGRYYTKRITIPKKFSGRTVWFQSDSNFAP